MVHAVNETIGHNVTVEFVDDDEYVLRNFQNDEGGKSEPSSEAGQVYLQDSRKAKLQLSRLQCLNSWGERLKMACRWLKSF